MFNILKKKNDEKLICFIIATGIASVATQLVVIREFLSLFSGNEFVISIILFIWLILGGFGTLAAKIFDRFLNPSLKLLAWLSVLLCVTGAVQIIAARFLYHQFFIYGASKDLYTIFGFSFMVCAPYCLVLGFLLPFTLCLIQKTDKNFSSVWVYMADNAGDAFGGAVFSIFLVWFFTPIQAVVLASVPLLMLTVLTLVKKDKVIIKKNLFFIVSAVILILLCISFEEFTLKPMGSELVFYRETPYGRVEVHEKAGAKTFYSNKIALFDTNNTIQAEQIVHFPLSQVPDPDKILFISASSGVFREIEKYSPGSIDYIEIDKQVSRAMFRFSFLKKIKNLTIINDDAIHYLKNRDKIYDTIIVDLPEPDNYQINRFYTLEFFRLLKKHLSKKGVISFAIQGFDNYPSKGLLKKISSLYNTAESCFDNVLVLPSADTWFIAGRRELKRDIPSLLRKKAVKTSYIKNYFAGDVTERKINRLKSLIDKSARKNRDYKPALINYAFKTWFEKFKITPVIFAFAAALIFLVYIFFLTGTETILFLTGFWAMGSELMILFSFQILFGFIYLKTGFIITVFLAGLLPGALVQEKRSRSVSRKTILFLEGWILLSTFIFIAGLSFFKPFLFEHLFYMASFGFGFLCGMQFSAVVHFQKGSSSMVTGFFAADLMGGAAAILIFSLIFLPCFGIVMAGISLCLIKSLGVLRFLSWKK